jgi:Cu/Ag efflux pump CusA
MGSITIGGIVSSTVLTLWFIPAIERLVIRRAKKPNGKGNDK